MVTRRNVIGGIAGIIAAQTAPAFGLAGAAGGVSPRGRNLITARDLTMGGKPKPYDYKVDYIEAPGVEGSIRSNVYSTIDLYPVDFDRFSFEFQFGGYKGYQAVDRILGYTTGEYTSTKNKSAFSFSQDNDNYGVTACIRGSGWQTRHYLVRSLSKDGFHRVEYSKSGDSATVTCEGSVLSIQDAKFSARNLPIVLFATRYETASYECCTAHMRIRRIAASLGGVPVANIYGCVKGGVPCLYDDVSNKFYYNEHPSGSSYIAGPTVSY